MYRKPVHKKHSAKQWQNGARKTRAANTTPRATRGGYRL